MKTEFVIDMLTTDSVSILKQTIDDTSMQTVTNERNSYMNSDSGRALLKGKVSEDIYAAVLEMWGDNPTVDDVVDDNTSSENKLSFEERLTALEDATQEIILMSFGE